MRSIVRRFPACVMAVRCFSSTRSPFDDTHKGPGSWDTATLEKAFPKGAEGARAKMSTELRQKLKQVEAEEAAHMAVLIGKTTCPQGVDAALFAPLPRHVPQWTGSPSAAEQNVAWGVP